jgi:hypothetical protein
MCNNLVNLVRKDATQQQNRGIDPRATEFNRLVESRDAKHMRAAVQNGSPNLHCAMAISISLNSRAHLHVR